MPTKKAVKAIDNPESLNVHANMLEQVAEFIQERDYLRRETWDMDSDRLARTLSALKTVRRMPAALVEDEHRWDYAALQTIAGQDIEDEDFEVHRLKEVRALVVDLLSCRAEEYGKTMAALGRQDDPRIDEILGEVRLGSNLLAHIIAWTRPEGTLDELHRETYDAAMSQPEGLRAAVERVRASRDPGWNKRYAAAKKAAKGEKPNPDRAAKLANG